MANVLDQSQVNTGDFWGLNDVDAHRKLAQGFVPSVTANVTQVILSLKKSGVPTGNLTVDIYNDGSGLPTTVKAASSNSIAESTLTTAFAQYTFTVTSTLINSGTQYHIALSSSDANAANEIYWESDGVDSYVNGHITGQKASDSLWVSVSAGDDMIFQEYYDDTTVVTGAVAKHSRTLMGVGA